MKKIIFIRHAKAEPKNSIDKDFERSISKKGKIQVYIMSKKLKDKKISPDCIITSPAFRSIETAMMFASSLHYSLDNIVIKQYLYFDITAEDFVHEIKAMPDTINTMLVFGHNPLFTSIVQYLIPTFNEKIPTCGIVGISNPVKTWKNFSKDNNKLLFFDYPKKYL